MMPLVRLVREELVSKVSVSPVFPETQSLSKMKWPRGRADEQVLYTNQDGFTDVDDQITASIGPTWDLTASLSENEAVRQLEDDWPLRRVHIRHDENVAYNQM